MKTDSLQRSSKAQIIHLRLNTAKIIRLIHAFLLLSYTLSAFGGEPTKPLSELQRDLVNLRFGMFIHFNPCTFLDPPDRLMYDHAPPRQGKDGVLGTADDLSPGLFNPKKLDCGQWADAAVSAGMKFAVLTTKHHDGFCLWPSKYSDYTVAQGFKRDVVREFTDAFRKRGLKVGLYYSIRDRTVGIADKAHGGVSPAQIQLIKNQLTDLLTQYGPILYIVFDAWGNGWHESPTFNDISYGDIYYHIKSIQPNCLVLNHSSEREVNDAPQLELTCNVKLPPGANWPAVGGNVIQKAWFWDPTCPTEEVKSVRWIVDEQLIPYNKRNTVFQLNCAPNRDGLMDDNVVKRLAEVGKAWTPPPPLERIPDSWKDWPVPLPIAAGPFQPTAESLKQYRCPEWFRDAKFGIWAHWGPQSVPGQGDWYARKMYEEGSDDYKFHVQHYGHPSKFGYKDIVALWKAEKFDPDRLVELYKRAGAKYLVAQGVHHDNFDLWNSKHHKWNAVNMGPHKDIVGLWAGAARKQGLRFGVSEHLERSYSWFNTNKGADKTGPLAGVPYDGNDPKYADFYFPPHEDTSVSYPVDPPVWWKKEWFDRVQDLVDSYHPDLLYTDGGIPFGEVGRSIVAHFYNANLKQHAGKLEAVYNIKAGLAGHGEYIDGAAVEECEMFSLNYLKKEPWQTEDATPAWYYDSKARCKSTAEIVNLLVGNVSKNGNLLLVVTQFPDGRLQPEAEQLLEQMAAWNAINGEAIYGTRPWNICGEGSDGGLDYNFVANAPEIRFTTKGNVLYAITLGWPADGTVLIHSLAKAYGTDVRKIKKLTVLGCDSKIEWSETPEGLRVQLPEKMPNELTAVVKLELDSPASDMAGYADKLPKSLASGKPATASSVFGVDVPSQAVDDNPGTCWSSCWLYQGNKINTWLEVDLGVPQTISSALLCEAYGDRIEEFSLQYWDHDQWKTFVTGTKVGKCWRKSFVPISAQRVRILVPKASSNPGLKEFRLFAEPLKAQAK